MLWCVGFLSACTGSDVSGDDDDTDTGEEVDTDDDPASSEGDDSSTTEDTGDDTDTGTEAVESDFDDIGDIDALPWPETVTSLPDCVPYDGGFETPDTAAAEGRVRMSPSATLQPVGVDERLEIKVYYEDIDERDPYADGALSIESAPEVDVVEVSDVSSGRSEALIRFREPGRHLLTGVFTGEDGETGTGTVEVMAYAPQLPIWEMAIDPSDLEEIVDDPYERIKVPAVLTVDGTAYETEVRLHGGSSRGYPKKSFRFDLGPDLTLEDTHDHIILRAEWNDKAMLRNFLGLEVFRNATWIPASEAEIVHFRINNRYYGAMWHVERIGGDFLRLRGLNNTTASMYEADPPSSCWTPGGDLTPVDDLATYQCIYDHKQGDILYDDLIDLIENTLQLSDDAFEDTINQVLDVNEYLLYMATMAVIQNHDHIKKNYFLYRDPGVEDDRWVVFPWDMELTFGHLWSEENDVLEEAIYTDEPLDFGICPGFCNQLMTRLYNVPAYQVRFLQFVYHILETTFTEAFIDERIDNVLCRATPDLVADPLKRASVSEYLDRVDEIRTFVDERRAYIQEE